LRLAQVLGIPAQFWLGLQSDWDLWHAMRSVSSAEIAHLQPLPQSGLGTSGGGARYEVVARLDPRMPHGAVAVEFVALILAEDERYLDAILGDVTAIQSRASRQRRMPLAVRYSI